MMKGQGTATGVTIDTPANGAAASKTTVCWHVNGSGNVAHVAIHWDTQSHASKADRTFADYSAGAAYPDNATALASGGYNLPGRFCTAVTIPASGTTLYIIGHVIDKNGAPGQLSPETTVKAVGGGTATSVDAPTGASSGAAGSMVTLCWVVHGTGNVLHVAIHWDTASHASKSDRTFADYGAGAAYPNNATALDRNGYDLTPAGTQFCTNAKLPASGSIYVIGHVIDKNGAPGIASTEKTVSVM